MQKENQKLAKIGLVVWVVIVSTLIFEITLAFMASLVVDDTAIGTGCWEFDSWVGQM